MQQFPPPPNNPITLNDRLQALLSALLDPIFLVTFLGEALTFIAAQPATGGISSHTASVIMTVLGGLYVFAQALAAHNGESHLHVWLRAKHGGII